MKLFALAALLGGVSTAAVAQTAPNGVPSQATAPTSQPDASSGQAGPSAQAAGDAAPAAAPLSSAAQSSYSTDGLGDGFFHRLFGYYKLEMGHASAPSDPTAPPSRRDGWTPQPENTPPMPFTEWPYGGATSIGVNRPASVDSPLMVALAPSGLGKALSSAHVQVYGWVDVGGNYSSNNVRGGNSPAAYDYEPRRIQLDQAVVYVERTPDTVQTDHVDWGFRVSGIYGVDYRYTTSLGLFSGQLTRRNNDYGVDLPMVYGEVYFPKIAQGLMVRFGRYISVPDIEAQLAPNNYMYSHSMTYTFDNYTNTGIVATLAVSKNLFLQFGIEDGTETALWNAGKRIANPFPNPLYPGASFRKDPGNQPTFTGCIRYQTNSARDNVYICMNGINDAHWGYNNLNWRGLTYYHKFSDKWHVSFEAYNEFQRGVPNANNAAAANIVAQGGTPFSPQYLPFNAPGLAYCANPNELSCKAYATGALTYLNFSPSPLNNISLRGEFFNDQEGQRTGTKTRYAAGAIGWQHWLSPQVELRPEVAYYRALDGLAFNGNSNRGIAPNKQDAVILSGDVILHF